jgi:hypothetical protein
VSLAGIAIAGDEVTIVVRARDTPTEPPGPWEALDLVSQHGMQLHAHK